MRAIGAAIFALLLAPADLAAAEPQAPAAGAADPSPKQAASGVPHWVRRPDAADVIKAYPDAASYAGQSGYAKIMCVTQADGGMGQCSIVTEAPAGAGFGEAALKLAPQFRLSLETDTGASTAGWKITIPIRFGGRRP